MTATTIVLGILLVLMAIFLTIAVLMQHGKSHNLSGTIAGGAETFFGKTKGRSLDAMLSKLTTIVAVIFVIIVALVYVLQPNEPAVQQIPDNGNIEIVDDLDVEPADDNNAEAEAPVEGAEAPAEGEASEPVEGTEAPAEGDTTAPVEEAAPATEGEVAPATEGEVAPADEATAE